ncbi:MAG TPA: DNA polymerase III subunit gamma/tau, partial [Candidatus Acetothermia bacterium]|nr:DNA polymerase III subunit gamma/tau [Candidatus Acetothermia bacterium]
MEEPTGAGLSIYRRWRPQRFSQVVGQPLVVETLRRAVAQGRLAHAYLFSGQRGVGKTSVARILARAVNCLSPQEGEPCNQCENCRRILSGKSLDVVEIDGASNRGIDQIRRLREEVGYVPAGARYKVYIIDEVHMLTGEAFNALLKTLEEPPPHVIFIFATTEPHKVPPTVLSRCQAFEFSPVPERLIQAKLREIAQAEGMEFSEEAAELIARRAGGSLRDAEVLLEQLSQSGPVTRERVVELLGLPTATEVDAFLEALLRKDAAAALQIVEKLSLRGRDLGLFLQEAAARARDRVMAGEDEFIPLARRLLELGAELPRALSRRLHLEVEILALCGPPTPQPAPDPTPEEEPPLTPPPTSSEGEPPLKTKTLEESWARLVQEILRERASVAACLAPAKVQLQDGLLTIRLPEECRFHYEMLTKPEVRHYLEDRA